MEQVKVWEQADYSNYMTYFRSKEELISYIKKNKSCIFNIVNSEGKENGEYATDIICGFIELDKKTIFFDKTHVAFIGVDLPELCISEEFYKENKEELDNAFKEVMYNEEDVTISKYLYSDELVKNLVLTANSIIFEDGIEVPLEIKELLDNNKIECFRTTNYGRTMLSSKKMLGNEYETIISEYTILHINENITDYENLKFIPTHKEIDIHFEHYKIKNYDNMYKIIKTLRDNGQENLVVLPQYCLDRKRLFESELINSNFSNVRIGDLALEDLKKENFLLELMVSDIKNSNYSPFEKYIAVYNIVKKFKQYTKNPEDEKDRSLSREVSKILNNDFMVCAGYARLLEELLYRVGIDSWQYEVGVDISYDDGFTLEEKTVQKDNHLRLIVNICDPKYGINGFYRTDPTWDNNLLVDYYNYALIGAKKNEDERRYFFLEDIDLILNCETFEQYQTNINFILNKYKAKKESTAIIKLILIIINTLKDLCPEKCIEFNQKYKDIMSAKDNYNYELAYEFIGEVGHFFVEHYGKDVPLETVIDAACVVNKDVFGFDDEQLQVYKEDLLEKNIRMDSICFPYYYNERYVK